MATRYPIYVISKGRWESRYTVKSLEKMRTPYKVVVEPSELIYYVSVIDTDKLLVLDSDLSALGLGSVPVRNWVWEHAINGGHKRHWLLDDNINGFERLNRNQRGRVYSDAMFRAAEDFVDRYKNVAFAGFEYRQFCGGARRKKPPFRLNGRVYSCTLINNNVPYRWRGKYNEDTDICLRALKDGWVTVSFNCFLQNKIKTMELKGGNTDTIYDTDDDRREFAESLRRQHPDVVKVVWRYGRWHHEVNYDKFADNKLVYKDGYVKPKNKINNYGMVKVDG